MIGNSTARIYIQAVFDDKCNLQRSDLPWQVE